MSIPYASEQPARSEGTNTVAAIAATVSIAIVNIFIQCVLDNRIDLPPRVLHVRLITIQ